MTTLSYPVTGSNITHAMWRQLNSRNHGGVDSGMALSLSSTSDDATIAVGSANFRGYQLDVTVSHVVTLAAVGTATVYTIGIMYNPANEAAAGGPLSLTGAVKSSLSIPSGGAFLPLYDVTRQPSQTLNLATVVTYKTLRASLLIAPTGTTTPAADPSGMGPAVIVRKTGLQVYDGTGGYVDVQPSLTWTNVTASAGAVASIGGPMQYRVIYGEVQFRGSVARSDGQAWTSTTGTVAVVIGTVGSTAFPADTRGWAQGGTSGQTITFRLSTSGTITMYVPSGTGSTLIDGSVYL